MGYRIQFRDGPKDDWSYLLDQNNRIAEADEQTMIETAVEIRKEHGVHRDNIKLIEVEDVEPTPA